MPKRIVITGGPGTGKTSVIKNLEEKGYFCFHEVIRDLTLEAKKQGDPNNFVTNPLAFVDDPFSFNQHLLQARLSHYKEGNNYKNKIVFYDRGIPDVLAYMRYFGQPYPKHFIDLCRENRYDRVIVLPPWEAIYATDEERMETFQEAKDIHNELLATYEEFQYPSIMVPKGSVEERTDFIITKVGALL